MRQKHDRESDLSGVRSHVAPDTPEVAGPGNSTRVDQKAGRDVEIYGESNCDDDE